MTRVLRGVLAARSGGTLAHMHAESDARHHRGDENHGRRAQRVFQMAEGQWGVVSLAQLRTCGLSRTTVHRWAQDGRLHRVLRSVYALGHRTLTPEAWWMAATLACGDGALLAARSALALYEVISPTSVIDVIPARYRGTGLPGIRIHRCEIAACEATTFHAIPVTTVARAFLDAACRLKPDQLTMALNEAMHRGRYDHGEMLATLARHPGHRGVRILREAVSMLGDEALRFRSRSEVKARELIVVAGLEVPEVNAWIPTRAGHGHELDLFWRPLMLDVEIDGPRHELPWHRRKDALRDADLDAIGVRVERFPWTAVDDRPDWFVARIAALLR